MAHSCTLCSCLSEPCLPPAGRLPHYSVSSHVPCAQLPLFLSHALRNTTLFIVTSLVCCIPLSPHAFSLKSRRYEEKKPRNLCVSGSGLFPLSITVSSSIHFPANVMIPSFSLSICKWVGIRLLPWLSYCAQCSSKHGCVSISVAARKSVGPMQPWHLCAIRRVYL